MIQKSLHIFSIVKRIHFALFMFNAVTRSLQRLMGDHDPVDFMRSLSCFIRLEFNACASALSELQRSAEEALKSAKKDSKLKQPARIKSRRLSAPVTAREKRKAKTRQTKNPTETALKASNDGEKSSETHSQSLLNESSVSQLIEFASIDEPDQIEISPAQAVHDTVQDDTANAVDQVSEVALVRKRRFSTSVLPKQSPFYIRGRRPSVEEKEKQQKLCEIDRQSSTSA